MTDDQSDHSIKSDDEGKPAGDSGGGEDESSTEHNGDDSHLHEDQKAPAFPAAEPDKKGPQ
ncbi:hypothetical protein HL653_22795 [Sphingomonas sp. AP4-R1]|uniref:hypothetical protein n=1 Tax=Sphingomonas sp. AP4-R1 TaxID=2735134 RepID=UPI001493649C|nr:hypothetical protein [Sphingomonas sp. AP4-R1]QJU60189.1 hypothetical protein HL653_22795 [Sphingomonas sp. AP4-R1]